MLHPNGKQEDKLVGAVSRETVIERLKIHNFIQGDE